MINTRSCCSPRLSSRWPLPTLAATALRSSTPSRRGSCQAWHNDNQEEDLKDDDVDIDLNDLLGEAHV